MLCPTVAISRRAGQWDKSRFGQVGQSAAGGHSAQSWVAGVWITCAPTDCSQREKQKARRFPSPSLPGPLEVLTGWSYAPPSPMLRPLR
jgi:hypothetical protein